MSTSARSQRLVHPLSSLRHIFAWGALTLLAVPHFLQPLPHTITTLPLVSANYVAATGGPDRKDGKSREHTASPFDMDTEAVSDGDVLEKWRGVTTEIAHEFDVLRLCETGGACPPEAQRLLEIVGEGSGRTGRTRIGLINRAVDLAVAPTSDERQWGTQDRWSAPFETLQSRRGAAVSGT